MHADLAVFDGDNINGGVRALGGDELLREVFRGARQSLFKDHVEYQALVLLQRLDFIFHLVFFLSGEHPRVVSDLRSNAGGGSLR